MVSNQKVLRAVLFFCKIVLIIGAVPKNYSKNTYHGNQLFTINITNVVNISNVASLPVKIEINEETNIELIHSEPGLPGDNTESVNNITKNRQTNKGNKNQSPDKGIYGIANFNSETTPLKYQIQYHQRPNTTTNDYNSKANSLATDNKERHSRDSQNKTISSTCCLVIYPPKCNISECIVRRKKMCWNVCTEEIVILEAPGFPKDKFPREFIPVNWRDGQFLENITITLVQPDTTRYQENNLYIDNGYQQQIYSQVPYPYFSPQNLANGQYQNVQYQPGYPYFSSYNFEPRPPLYWCPGPYCPLFTRSYY